MRSLNRLQSNTTNQSPIRVVQFGEGNFLRAFADWMVDILNQRASYDAGVAVVQPIKKGMIEVLEKQEGLYHLMMRGISKGEVKKETRLISCVQEYVNPYTHYQSLLDLAKQKELQLLFSNTTEAGIEFKTDDVPDEGHLAKTFPGKLTQFLHHRFTHYNGEASAGLGIIPCELIDRNGDKLREAILQYVALWNLQDSFEEWIQNSNYFGNTLVDRIVTGFPHDEISQIVKEIGFDDQLVVTSELFHLWVIEGPPELEKIFPAHLHGLNVKYVRDQTPYRTRKVRILNGSHTSMVAVGLLAGLVTVKESIEDPIIGLFLHDLISEEIISTIDLPKPELHQFADEVIERFKNPFIRHELSAIALNSISKFKVRVLPSILDFIQHNKAAPVRLCIAFAALIKLYIDGVQGKFNLSDDAEYIAWFEALDVERDTNELIAQVLSNTDFWEQDLTQNQPLQNQVTQTFQDIQNTSIRQVIETVSQKP